MSYLCNRNRETKIANDKVPWMSGLVSGLQNRVRRFESARNLQKRKWIRMKISNPFSLFSYLRPDEARLTLGQRLFLVGNLSFKRIA